MMRLTGPYPAAFALMVGVGGALALGHLLASLLFGVSSRDPMTMVTVSVILVLVALVACFFPARRAAKVDPLTALRHE